MLFRSPPESLSLLPYGKRWPVDTGEFFIPSSAALLLATFGAASVNLVTQFSANLNYMLEHGWIAVEEDGLLQLVQLLGTTYV